MVRIIIQGVEDIWSNIYSQLKKQDKNFEWFSLILRVLTDVTDTAQLFS